MRGGVPLSLTLLLVQAPAPLEKQNEDLFRRIREVHAPPDAELEALESVFAGSRFLGQGNPKVTVHPMTREECQTTVEKSGVGYENPEFESICGAKYMAPLYDAATETPRDARTCIDQFEFPNIPCEYPVVWVRAREAALLCESSGKRLCDAHEWEGACAGSLEAPDYAFELARGVDAASGVRAMRAAHNRTYDPKKVWSYGSRYRTGVCAATSFKTQGCEGGGWNQCGSNTFPAGAFPECRSELMVYDLHGNAAEHMNLPLDESQMSSRGSEAYGYTEMKGSWFIFDRYKAHEDACRWRAPFWHGSRVMDEKSHHNYHLGFRCCKTLSQ
jgi:formylglycine-generating enzyme required for sulfatase activity